MAVTEHTEQRNITTEFYAIGTMGDMYSRGDRRTDTLTFDVTRFGDLWDLSATRMCSENGMRIGTLIAYESDFATKDHAMVAADKYTEE